MGMDWTEKEAAHLIGRATFFSGKEEIRAALLIGKEETVRRLVEGEPLVGSSLDMLPFDQLQVDGKPLATDQIADRQVYWLYRMAVSPSPLVEKMTLFWHGHFATSYQKVREIPLLMRQNELFRNYALGNFHELVDQVGKDPAMMLYLDSNNNRKGKPNENYAREVMELFTLGIGHYTEQDIREAARALTGWTYDKKTDKVSFNPKQHDAGSKTVLGETGDFDENDIVDVLFKQEALPRFVARKLLVYFADPQPSDAWVDELAAQFVKTYDIGETLRYLFLSDAFYAEEKRGALIKTPVEYVAGIMKAFRLPPSKGFISAMRKMGQELFLPPDVAGWRGGDTWLMTSSLLARYQFAESVAKKLNGNTLSAGYMLSPEAKAEDWITHAARTAGVWSMGEQTAVTLAGYAEETFVHATQKLNGVRGLLQLVMISPEAQMK